MLFFFSDTIAEDARLSDDLRSVGEVFFASLAHQPCVVVIDGLDCVTSHDSRMRQLEWLLEGLPAHVRLIVSTCRSDITFAEFSKRADVQVLEMGVMKSAESQVCEELINKTVTCFYEWPGHCRCFFLNITYETSREKFRRD